MMPPVPAVATSDVLALAMLLTGVLVVWYLIGLAAEEGEGQAGASEEPEASKETEPEDDETEQMEAGEPGEVEPDENQDDQDVVAGAGETPETPDAPETGSPEHDPTSVDVDPVSANEKAASGSEAASGGEDASLEGAVRPPNEDPVGFEPSLDSEKGTRQQGQKDSGSMEEAEELSLEEELERLDLEDEIPADSEIDTGDSDVDEGEPVDEGGTGDS